MVSAPVHIPGDRSADCAGLDGHGLGARAGSGGANGFSALPATISRPLRFTQCSLLTRQRFRHGVKVTCLRWLMAWLKVVARFVKTTTTATDREVKVCEWYYAYPFSEELEPERREQRVRATRSWHDPSKVAGRIRESGGRPAMS